MLFLHAHRRRVPSQDVCRSIVVGVHANGGPVFTRVGIGLLIGRHP